MKISETSVEALYALTPKEKWDIVCGGVSDTGACAPFALLLGGKPTRSVPRAEETARLYKEGRFERVIPSGGVLWEYEGEEISEACLMKRILLAHGVPEEAILLENEARTTKENMIYASLQLVRATKLRGVDELLLITSFWHLRRSMALAKALLPRKLTVHGCPVAYPEDCDAWLHSEEGIEILNKELRILHRLVKHRIADDFEI